MALDPPVISEEEQQSFYNEALSASMKAVDCLTGRQHVITVADISVKLHFPNELIAESILPAISHLLVGEDVQPDAEFYVWDRASTKGTMPPPPCSSDKFTNRGDIWGFNSPRYRIAFHWSDYSVNLFDRESKTGIYWVDDVTTVPYWSLASPLRSLFHWLMVEHNKQLVHAASIGYGDEAIVITGKGGMGKSTTALSCLSQGLKYVGDDYVILGNEGRPMVYSLYSTAKLNADQQQKFPCFRNNMSNAESLDSEKATYYLYPDHIEQIAHKLPVRLILTPSLSDCSHTSIRPVSRDLLLSAATFTTMSQLPYSDQRTHDFMRSVLDGASCGELSLGHDLGKVVDTIREVLSAEQVPAELVSVKGKPVRVSRYPLISVVIPVYNGASFLESAIHSVLAQDYPSIEIIVVDDGSTDDIAEVVASLPVDVRYYPRENKGPAAARNFGIMDAGGDFLAFLDVDDLWPENTLNLTANYLMQNADVDVVKGHAQVLTRNEGSGTYRFTGDPSDSFPDYIGAALYRRDVFQHVGLFDTELTFGEDTDWYNRAKEIGSNVQVLDAVTLHVRRHGENMTAKASDSDIRALITIKKAMDRRRALAGELERT